MIVEVLSRIQFAFSIGFHILFPTLNLGLAIFLTIMEAKWVSSGNPIYLQICQFWTKIFALTFGMGVVSGIVLAYQIGTNFGPFIAQFGNVLGALFAYETLTAFFLEAGFLGVMLFGWKKVPPTLHFTATLLVAIGTTISAFWILSANSWMQTPSGYDVINGKYVVASWLDVVFNPSFIPRMLHMIFASYSTTCFVVAAVSSYFLLRHKHLEIAKTCLSFVMWAALIVIPAQIYLGDVVGLAVHQQQPLKTAAMEGVWETQRAAPFLIFAWPSQQEQKNYFEIAIPKLASFLNTHELDGELLGLKSVARADQPLVVPVFFSFRIMVAIGLLMLFTAVLGLMLRATKRLYTSRRFHQLCLFTAPLGFIASICGWFTAEIGRQPWVVYNLMRTEAAVSAIGVEEVIISLVLLILAYGIVFGFYLYYLLKTIRRGPLSNPDVEHHAFKYMSESRGGARIMLPFIFAGLLAFIVIMYVILDGFDLGIGILFPFTEKERERDQMMNSVAPVWDGNETWLVFGGAMLYGAFPLVYGLLLPILYMPIMLMLIALIFRGVSFEFRFKAEGSKPLWNWAFAMSSIAAAFFQGVILGCFVQGFPIIEETLTINDADWLTPFSMLTGVALVCGYALLGATWMLMKSEGRLQLKMAHLAKGFLVLVSFFLIFVSIWTPLHSEEIFARWYSFPNILILSPLPLITTVVIVLTWRSISKRKEVQAFLLSIAIFLCSYTGIGVSVFPYLIPPRIDIWEAAAPPSTLLFILVGVVILLPVLLAYTAYAYHVFRGKSKEGYH